VGDLELLLADAHDGQEAWQHVQGKAEGFSKAEGFWIWHVCPADRVRIATFLRGVSEQEIEIPVAVVEVRTQVSADPDDEKPRGVRRFKVVLGHLRPPDAVLR
jgi:hypothetical protein